jgi:hypothetical protein
MHERQVNAIRYFWLRCAIETKRTPTDSSQLESRFVISSVFVEWPADPKGVKRVIVSAKPLPIISDNRIFARAVLDLVLERTFE